jgi:hypothetical protein
MSGITSTAAAAGLPGSLSAAPLAPTLLLLVRVRVLGSRDISVFLFVAPRKGGALSNPFAAVRSATTVNTRARVPFGIWLKLLPFMCRE